MAEPRWVRAETGIYAPAEAVVDAFTSLDALREWWGVEKGLVEARPGGPWALAWGVGAAGLANAAVGVVERVEPRELVVANVVFLSADRPFLGPTRIHLRVKQRSDKAIATLEETGYGEGPEWDRVFEESRQAWPAALVEVKRWLEARHPAP